MLQKLSTYFFDDYQFKEKSKVFKKLLYGFILFKCVYWLCYYDLLFGVHSVIYSKPFLGIGPINHLAFLLYAQAEPAAGLWFILPLILLCITALFGIKIPLLSDLLIWFLVINIHNKTYIALTGGDLLLNQFLFFQIFISGRFIKKNGTLNDIKIVIHNLGVLSVMVQVCFVYLFSAVAKLGDAYWVNGSAIRIISGIDHFSLPFISAASQSFPWLFIALNYIVFGYQLLFPLMIWFKKLKRPFLIVGVVMHLYIALVMGIVSFSMMMILSYTFFWPDKKQN